MNASSTLAAEAQLIAAKAKSLGLSQVSIAEAIGASQSQVSRVLAGTAKRRSRLFDRVCKYVNSAALPAATNSRAGAAALERALSEVWDGTEAHAEALALVIRSLGVFTAPTRGQGSRPPKAAGTR